MSLDSLGRAELLVKGPAYLLNRLRRGLGLRWRIPLSVRVQRRRIATAIRTARPDVVNAQDVVAALAAAPICRDEGIRLVLTVHGYLAYEAISAGDATKAEEAYLLGVERRGMHTADCIVAVDQRIAAFARAHGAKAVCVVENAVDVSRLQPPSSLARAAARERLGVSGDVVVCPRRLVKKNGVEVAVRAMPRLIECRPGTTLAIAGEGPEDAALRAMASQLDVADHVQFLGAQSPDQIVELLAAADVAVIPSVAHEGVEEATSIAALEAMAAGVPVVASAIGGLPEIVTDERTGLLIAPGDADALADAAERVLNDDTLAARLAAAARADVVANHSHLAHAERLRAIYLGGCS